MIRVFGGTKGGGGKSTIAINMAIMRAQHGKRVMLIDGDQQMTASKFSKLREATLAEMEGEGADIATYTHGCFFDENIIDAVPGLATDYDDIIIDAGGRDNSSLRAAMTIADAIYMPFRPRQKDLWTLGDMEKLVYEAREKANPSLDAYSFINLADTFGERHIEAAAFLKRSSAIKYLDIVIRERIAFSNADEEGEGVTEYRPADNKAIAEISALYDKVFRTRKPFLKVVGG